MSLNNSKEIFKITKVKRRLEKVDNCDVEHINRLLRQKVYQKYTNRVQTFRDYCNNTTIHGFKYLGEAGRSPVERVWWILIMVLSLVLCFGLVYINYRKWERSPILVTPATSPLQIWEIPFPTVMICFPPLIRKSVYDYEAVQSLYEGNRTTMSQNEIDTFNLVESYCKSYLVPSSTEEMEFLEKITFKIDDFFENCFWKEENVSCSSIFFPFLTGLEAFSCFTFNQLDRQDFYVQHEKHFKNYMSHGRRTTGWSLQRGYPKLSGLHQYPRRAVGDLSFTVKVPDEDVSPGCIDLRGYAVGLYNPVEYPRDSVSLLSPNKNIMLNFKPSMSVSSDDLKSYSPKERNCYFENERKLAYFKEYTRENCQEECASNISIAGCGCTTFDMAEYSKVPYCGYKQLECVSLLHKLFWAYDGNTDAIGTDNLFLDLFINKLKKYVNVANLPTRNNLNCKCYPSCTTLKYTFDKLEYDKFADNQQLAIRDGPTTISISFEKYMFYINERKKLFELIDFFANCGGILGLFTGISFVSIFEIVYFLTLRIWCGVVNKNKIGWVGN